MMKWILVAALAVGCGKKAAVKAGFDGATVDEKVVVKIPGESRIMFEKESYTISKEGPPVEIYLINHGPGTLAFDIAGPHQNRSIWPVTVEDEQGTMYTFNYTGQRMRHPAIVPTREFVVQPGEKLNFPLANIFYKIQDDPLEVAKEMSGGDIEEFTFEVGEYWLHVNFQGKAHKTKLIITS